jgi:hypothetical protein
MKIGELLDSIETRSIVLPEFQREYVWNKEQAKQLLDSLMKEYPVGGLLFWKTNKPPELKNISHLPEQLGTVTVILDGQQRLTTLYMLLRGKIPPYYRDADIIHDPRDLFFNLDTGEFQYYSKLRMEENPLWVRAVDAFADKKINVFAVASRVAGKPDDALSLAQRYNDNLTNLRNVEKIELPTQTVPLHASLDDAITIFDLVNSQGTKLTDAELALTHVTGKWAQARRVIKSKIDKLSQAHYYFDLTFMTRALTAVVSQRALYETIHNKPRAELEAGWNRVSTILDYLASVLPKHANVDSTRDLSTNNVLVPLVAYLSLNNGVFPDHKAIKSAIHWLYAAQIWARYTAQTDQRLEQDISIVVREAVPWPLLVNQIIDQRGRIEVKAADLDGRGVQHPLYNMAFMLGKAGGAVDWSNGAPLEVPSGQPYTLQNAYIFPPSLLYKSGYDSDNHIHRTKVNEVANRVVLKSYHPFEGKSPEEYFPLIEQKYPGTLSKQFVPMEPQLWRLEHYEDFLAARREMIARKVNEFMNALIAEPQIMHRRPLQELIGLGESATLEFKSSFQWDVVQGQVNKELRLQSLKTIVAFLNSGGGTLVIGVEDNGAVFGLDQDLLSVKNNNLDGFQQLLASQISELIGAGFWPYIKMRFEELDGHQVCVVDVERSSEPAYVSTKTGQDFYVRLASTSKKLDAQDAIQYVQANW